MTPLYKDMAYSMDILGISHIDTPFLYINFYNIYFSLFPIIGSYVFSILKTKIDEVSVFL